MFKACDQQIFHQSGRIKQQRNYFADNLSHYHNPNEDGTFQHIELNMCLHNEYGIESKTLDKESSAVFLKKDNDFSVGSTINKTHAHTSNDDISKSSEDSYCNIPPLANRDYASESSGDTSTSVPPLNKD